MLSKRNLLMMLTIIFVVLVIFLSSVILKEYYNDEIAYIIKTNKDSAYPKELNYLCELVPVRFDSDSLTFTQKSPVRYELSLNFKEIIKE